MEGAAEARIHHQGEAVTRAIAISVESQSGKIRNRGPNDLNQKEKKENQNRDRNIGLKTGQFDFEVFNLNPEVFSRLIRILDDVKLSAKPDAIMHGFTDNSNPGTISLTNCTSYNNGVRDWDCGNINLCRDAATSHNVFKNILSFCEGNKTSNVTLKTTLANSKDQYKGAVSYSVFYSGLALRHFADLTSCDYSNSNKKGELIQENITDPFVSAQTPQPMSSKGVPSSQKNDIHALLRAADGSIKLGDLFKIKTTCSFATMGEGGKALGCDLSGEGK